MSKPKILTLDIETLPLESYTWGLFDQNVGLDMIKTEWSILSYAAKWLDRKTVIYADTMGRGVDKVRDDKSLVGEIWKLLDSADIVVAQNGQRFDIKKINARLIQHGYGPYSPVKVVDTLLVARRHFAFTSKKLEWMSKYLTDSPKEKHKEFPGFELWAECLKDNPKARKELKKYNKQDVISTEKLYLKQRPWIDGHPNIGTYNLRGDVQCPKCGSAKVTAQGIRVLVAGVYQRYKCENCGGWARGKLMLNDKNVRKVKLT